MRNDGGRRRAWAYRCGDIDAVVGSRFQQRGGDVLALRIDWRDASQSQTGKSGTLNVGGMRSRLDCVAQPRHANKAGLAIACAHAAAPVRAVRSLALVRHPEPIERRTIISAIRSLEFW